MKTALSLLFILILGTAAHKSYAQPSIAMDSSAAFFDTLQISTPRLTGYTLEEYLKDSAENMYIYDSLKHKWSYFDTSIAKTTRKEHFPFFTQKEYKRNCSKPYFITYFIILLTVLFMLKKTYFAKVYQQEFLAAYRPFYFKNWIDEMLALINLYNVFSKILSLLLFACFFSIVLLRMGWQIHPDMTIQSLLIIAICFVYALAKYIGSFFLGYLFNKIELSKLHFTIHQINQSFIWVPLFLLMLCAYFLYGTFPTQILFVIGALLMGLERLYSLLKLGYWGFFKLGEKKLYLFLYLCTFEILPVVIISRYVALAYI